MALMEEIVYRNGHVINNNWTDKLEMREEGVR
jgi:hypothetical protein